MATMTGKEGNPLHMLYKLIELDYDAIEAYDAALVRIDDSVSKSALAGFRADHERHVRELGGVLRGMGFDPPQKGDYKRVLTKGKVILGNVAGDRGILLAMKTNEDDTNHAYERAITRADLTPDVRQIIERNLADERRHRTWIEQRLSALRSLGAQQHQARSVPR
jgi:uncharacterized protein (TIGR02284 family)